MLNNEFFNFSSSKYFKNFLFNHNIRNRNEETQFNSLVDEKYFSSLCNNVVFKEIDKVFISSSGAIKFSYEPATIYMIKYFPMLQDSSLIANR
jgi:hypothetical protein